VPNELAAAWLKDTFSEIVWYFKTPHDALKLDRPQSYIGEKPSNARRSQF